MKLLKYFARLFVMTFGITQPTPAQERSAAIYIASLCVLIAVGIVALAIFLTTHGIGH